MKPGRQNVILEIISTEDIETQFDLMDALARRGIKSTQATLSRDIKDMNLIKQMGPNGRQRYVRSPESETVATNNRLKNILKESVIRVDVAQNLIVIHTIPGLAAAAASAFDKMSVQGMVGTLAGDDTVFIALKDCSLAEEFYNQIESLL